MIWLIPPSLRKLVEGIDLEFNSIQRKQSKIITSLHEKNL